VLPVVTLCFAHRFVVLDAEGFKWFHVAPGGVAGRLRGAVPWANIRGAARGKEWNGRFGAQIMHPGAKNDVTILWCETEMQRDEIVAAVMTELVSAMNSRKTQMPGQIHLGSSSSDADGKLGGS
jgi:hypothetical protein